MAWYESKKGWGFGAVAVAYGILEHYEHASALAEIYRFAKTNLPQWATISPFIAPALFVLAIVFFELDRRRGKRPDPRTLKGRAVNVRDKMQAFLDSLGEQPKGYLAGETDTEFIVRASAETGRRWNLLGHFYELNCAAEVSRIFHEFGIRGVEDNALEGEILSRKKEEEYRTIIESLTKLSETPEAKTRI